METSATYILYAGRTAIGKLQGAFAATPAPQLAAAVIKDAMAKTGLAAKNVDEIILGNVLTAGVGQAPARQAAIYGGLPHSVCATTINRVCGSGLKSVMLADQSIRLGDSEIILAGGMENMTLAPHLLPGIRAGVKFGGFAALDHMQIDGLVDPYSNSAMGVCGELCAKEYDFSREKQDDFAMKSYEKARSAAEKGYFQNEIVPIEVRAGKATQMVTQDEEPFASDLAKLPSLRPAFDKNGTITAGNASSINDGASVLMLASESALKKHNLKPLAKIVAQASFAHDPSWFTTAPVDCIRKVLAKAGLSVAQIDLFEINEAFAVVTMAAIQKLEIDPNKVNVNGGAVALGHPIGASGARVLTTLTHSLIRHKKRYGLATLCIGGGEASAVIIEVC
ncbi:MAG: thiolase family protein [Pseudomonadota bacterium]